jgi:hypothetical protein
MTAQPQQHNATVTPLTPFPKFEGSVVEGTEVRITGQSKIEAATGLVCTTDDVVRIIGEYKCIGVRHETNKDGQLVRVQILRPISVDVCPWDPADPADDGVQRSRAIPGWSAP